MACLTGADAVGPSNRGAFPPHKAGSPGITPQLWKANLEQEGRESYHLREVVSVQNKQF